MHEQVQLQEGGVIIPNIDILVVQNECLLVSFIGFDVEIDHRVISILLQRRKELVQHITLRHPCRWPNYAQWQ